MPMDPLDLAAVGSDLVALTDLLRNAQMRLPGRASHEFRAERDEILSTFDGYLRPRLENAEAPIVAAIVGPSGAGKSTLLNSIAQSPISVTGVVRPTTEKPLVWADAGHPQDAWIQFVDRASARFGSELRAVRGDNPLTAHLTVVDTPPLNDESDAATKAIAIADICIFVTTPTRYADGSSWQFLKRTRRRGIPLLFVMNRLPHDMAAAESLLGDFAKRLHQRELLAASDPSLLFGIADGDIQKGISGLDTDAVASIRKELAEVADPVYRTGLVDETVYATARMVVERTRALTRPLAAELPVINSLMTAVAHAYDAETASMLRRLDDGDLAASARSVDWATAAADVVAVITRRAGNAAHRTASTWSTYPEAIDLLEADGSQLWRHGPDTAESATEALNGWRSGLDALVSSHALPRRLRWGFSRRRAVETVWRAELAGMMIPQWAQRKLVDRGDALVVSARAGLRDAIREGLADDATRFTRAVADNGTDELYDAIVDAADKVDTQLDVLAAQLPDSWSDASGEDEPEDPVDDDVIAVEIAEGSTVIELGGVVEGADEPPLEDTRPVIPVVLEPEPER